MNGKFEDEKSPFRGGFGDAGGAFGFGASRLSTQIQRGSGAFGFGSCRPRIHAHLLARAKTLQEKEWALFHVADGPFEDRLFYAAHGKYRSRRLCGEIPLAQG